MIFKNVGISFFKVFTYWTWHTSQVTPSPLFETIFLGECYVSLLLCLTFNGVTIVMIGVITDLVCSVRLLKDEIQTGMLRYVEYEDKNSKCMELLNKCIEYHTGLIK